MNNFISYNQYKKSGVLNETYESFRELEDLSEIIYDKFKKGVIFHKFKAFHLYPITKFIDFDKEFKIINDFINNGKVGILYMIKLKKGSVQAQYVPKNSFDSFENMSKKYMEFLDKNFNGIVVVYNFKTSSILHELEHAYDDYRSKGKFTKTKRFNKFIKLKSPDDPISFKQDDVKDEESIKKTIKKIQNRWENYYDMYSRSSHEISSYFIQAIHSINFLDENTLNLKDIHDTWNLFKLNYSSYNRLTDKMKKDLARKFSQYYNKINDEYEKTIKDNIIN